MFVVARILIGFGTVASGCAGPPYLAETLPLHWRGWGLGIFNDAYYIGQWNMLRWAYRLMRSSVLEDKLGNLKLT